MKKTEWISVADQLPPKDEQDDLFNVSIEVLTFSEYGMRFGGYFLDADRWRVEGVTSTHGVKVTHWTIITPPESCS